MEQPLGTTDAALLSAVEADCKLLTTPGNIGFYRRCSFVEVFLTVKDSGDILPLYTLATFEDAVTESLSPTFNGLPYSITAGYKLGIRVYDMTTEDAESVLLALLRTNCWTAHNDGRRKSSSLKPLRRQFVPPVQYRTNAVLKNNFFGGSHLLEFFDESKESFAFLTDLSERHLLAKLTEEIENRTQLNFFINPDRLGNVVFQFPVNVLDVTYRIEENNTRYRLNFAWHPRLGGDGKGCTIISWATLEKTVIHQALFPYNGNTEQFLPITAIDKEAVIEVIDQASGLLLSQSTPGPPIAVALMFTFLDPSPRVFYLDGQENRVSIKQMGTPDLPAANYKDHIRGSSYSVEKRELINRLDFKQYWAGMEEEALDDLQKLIRENDRQGVNLWDPYLRAADIFRTLYYSSNARVPLRAICSFSSKKRRGDLQEDALSIEQLIQQQRTLLSHPLNRNHSLNLEFRTQYSEHGYGFHDRFLLFPGYGRQPPKVYTLGTSVNAMGKSHHILQLVPHPQPVIDAFYDLWDRLQHPDCLVWKS